MNSTIACCRAPTPEELAGLDFAWPVAARVTSITIVRPFVSGPGSRIDAMLGVLAAAKADGRAKGAACASDTSFPFNDGLEAAIDAGCTAVVQPGAIRDEEVIAVANDDGLAMVFTGERDFVH